MHWSRFNRIVLSLCLAAAVTVPALNLTIDPYDVFGTGLLGPASTTNERVAKARFVVAQPNAFDTMIMGSSIAGVIDPRLLAAGGTAYNFSFFSATPGDILKTLQMLERARHLPRRLYVALDPIMFTRPVPGAPQMRLPPEASGERAWTFWRDYLFAGSTSALIAKVSERLADVRGVVFDLQSGAYSLPGHEREAVRDPAAYARRRVDGSSVPLAPGWWHRPAEDDLVRLVAWLRARPWIDVVWFLQPLHHRLHAALGADGPTYLQRTRAVVGSALRDLSTHPIGSDSTLWWDLKHYRPAAAPLLVAALRQTPSPDLHNDIPRLMCAP